MSFIRVVMTCQPVYKTHVFAISIPGPRPSGKCRPEGTDDDVKVVLCAAFVDIANFNDYRPSLYKLRFVRLRHMSSLQGVHSLGPQARGVANILGHRFLG